MDIAIQLLLTVLSILIVLVLESLKKPRLRFMVGEPGEIRPDDRAGREAARWLHVYVRNEPMPWWIAWAWNRDPALTCRGGISFESETGEPLFEKDMPIRWANNPEPLILDPITGAPTGVDWDKMRVGHQWDIPPGSTSQGDYGVLDVAFRAQKDTEAFGWNNDSYLHAWRNPEWVLPKGRFRVIAKIRTGGQVSKGEFRLLNDGPYELFRLEPLAP